MKQAEAEPIYQHRKEKPSDGVFEFYGAPGRVDEITIGFRQSEKLRQPRGAGEYLHDKKSQQEERDLQLDLPASFTQLIQRRAKAKIGQRKNGGAGPRVNEDV